MECWRVDTKCISSTMKQDLPLEISRYDRRGNGPFCSIVVYFSSTSSNVGLLSNVKVRPSNRIITSTVLTVVVLGWFAGKV